MDLQKDMRLKKEATGRWTREEHELFLLGLQKFDRKWKSIASMIPTRTVLQVRTHAQKYFQKLQRLEKKRKTSTGENNLCKRILHASLLANFSARISQEESSKDVYATKTISR